MAIRFRIAKDLTGSIYSSRLGQGAFRVVVTEAYHRRCAISGEKTLPVLEAAHIKPYTQEGPHEISNGLRISTPYLTGDT